MRKNILRCAEPILWAVYFTLCVLLLAVAESGSGGRLLLTCLFVAALAAAVRWGIYALLRRAARTVSPKAQRVLIRATTGIGIALTVASLITAVLLYALPAVWLFPFVPLSGVCGARKADR